jgi:hypothetical protein
MASSSRLFGGIASVRGLVLGLTLCVLVASAEGGGVDCPGTNRLEGIKPFELDQYSGSMALHALGSSLGAYDLETAYQRLVGLSGAAFKFVYDSTEAFEPLRDLYPMDVLTGASRALGFDDAHWVTGEPIGTVMDVIRNEIDNRRPVLAPYLRADAYHGFFIVTGYDFDRHLLCLQGAFEGDSAYVAAAIPEAWDGPTVSPAGWATNPIFVIGERKREGRAIPMAGKRPVEQAISAMKGGSMRYGTHPGEHAYMRYPGPHEALYGLPAYDLLSLDIENRELIERRGGEATLNFAFIWRINSQLGQLEHDRRHGADFSRLLSSGVPKEKRADMNEIRQNLLATADDAGTLRRFFWHELADTLEADEVAACVTASSSMVFKIPDIERLRNQLRADGFDIFETAWGWILVDDSHQKRMLAKTALRSIVVRERRSLEILEGVVDHIGKRPSIKRPADRSKRPPRRR